MQFHANAEFTPNEHKQLHEDKLFNEDKELEPLEGEVCPQFIRCGKPGCRCQYDKPHGPYHYRIWREGTRVRKVYVKATEVEAVRAACILHRKLSRSLQDVRQEKLQLTQSMNKEWRRTQRLIAPQ